jgi:hypothetical protein
VRIDVRVSQKFVAIRNDSNPSAWLERSQRRALRIDFIGEHPEMSGGNAPIFAALEAQLRQLRRVVSSVHRYSAGILRKLPRSLRQIFQQAEAREFRS